MSKQVIYVGDTRRLGDIFRLVQNKTTALMDDNGLVQLDGNDEWRLSEGYKNPWCFNWYDLGYEWKEIQHVEEATDEP
jgi:hypothetical protein